MKQTTKTQ